MYFFAKLYKLVKLVIKKIIFKIVKIINQLFKLLCSSTKKMNQLGQSVKNILITGANRGIGLKLVETILYRCQQKLIPNHNVIMTARDKYKGQEAF